jgi:hypothetical protein
MSLVAQIFTQWREVLDEGGGGVSDVPIAVRLWSTKSVNSFPLDVLFRRSWLYDSGEPTNNDSSTTVVTMRVKCKQDLVSVCVCATSWLNCWLGNRGLLVRLPVRETNFSSSAKHPKRCCDPPNFLFSALFGSCCGLEQSAFKLITHPHLGPSLRIRGYIPPPLWNCA